MLKKAIYLTTLLSLSTGVNADGVTVLAGGQYSGGCSVVTTPDQWGFYTNAYGSCVGVAGGAQYDMLWGSLVADASLVNFSPSGNDAKSTSTLNYGLRFRRNAGLARGQYRYNGIYSTFGVEKDNLVDAWGFPFGMGYRTISNFLLDVEYVMQISENSDSFGYVRTSLYYSLPL